MRDARPSVARDGAAHVPLRAVAQPRALCRAQRTERAWLTMRS
jgi:hypothetical protein